MMHLYIEGSAELQIYRPMLNKVHMHLYLYSISPNDHLPNFYRSFFSFTNEDEHDFMHGESLGDFLILFEP